MSDASGAGSAAADDSGAAGLVKAPTGIGGFDEITRGGLPHGRATLVTGGAGSGKTLFGLEFLVWGARKFGEPGVLLSFEESADELATNVASLGFDLPELEREGLLITVLTPVPVVSGPDRSHLALRVDFGSSWQTSSGQPNRSPCWWCIRCEATAGGQRIRRLFTLPR